MFSKKKVVDRRTHRVPSKYSLNKECGVHLSVGCVTKGCSDQGLLYIVFRVTVLCISPRENTENNPSILDCFYFMFLLVFVEY